MVSKRNIQFGSIFIIVVVLFVIHSLFISPINNHFEEYINGFWTGDTIDGNVLLYFDDSHIRIIETDPINETVNADRMKYELANMNWLELYNRKYRINIICPDGYKFKTSLGHTIHKGNTIIDLFPIEGTMIVADNNEDLVTLIKDIKSNLFMLV